MIPNILWLSYTLFFQVGGSRVLINRQHQTTFNLNESTTAEAEAPNLDINIIDTYINVQLAVKGTKFIKDCQGEYREALYTCGWTAICLVTLFSGDPKLALTGGGNSFYYPSTLRMQKALVKVFTVWGPDYFNADDFDIRKHVLHPSVQVRTVIQKREQLHDWFAGKTLRFRTSLLGENGHLPMNDGNAAARRVGAAFMKELNAVAIQDLALALYATDDRANLPRVFIPQIEWNALGGSMSMWQGHIWIIVKRENQKGDVVFQVLQGYVHNSRTGEAGYDLSKWLCSTNPLANIDGVGIASMGLILLEGLSKFVENSGPDGAGWDSENHAAMFNVQERAYRGHQYWAYFTYAEVSDSPSVPRGILQDLVDEVASKSTGGNFTQSNAELKGEQCQKVDGKKHAGDTLAWRPGTMQGIGYDPGESDLSFAEAYPDKAAEYGAIQSSSESTFCKGDEGGQWWLGNYANLITDDKSDYEADKLNELNIADKVKILRASQGRNNQSQHFTRLHVQIEKGRKVVGRARDSTQDVACSQDCPRHEDFPMATEIVLYCTMEKWGAICRGCYFYQLKEPSAFRRMFSLCGPGNGKDWQGRVLKVQLDCKHSKVVVDEVIESQDYTHTFLGFRRM